MDKILKELKMPVLLIFAGVLFIGIALIIFDLNGKTAQVVETMNFTNWLLLSIGTLLLFAGVSWVIFDPMDYIFNKNSFKFKKAEGKYTLALGGNCNVNIIYGNINDFQDVYDEDTLVILSADDKFDDKCVDDPRSVLGRFVKNLYPNGNQDFKDKIKKQLEKSKKTSYSIGEWVYLPDINNAAKKFTIGIIAVTHLNEDNSVTASPENIMLAFQGIRKIAAQNSPSKIFIPLIGSGHGGLPVKFSFLNILISTIYWIKKGQCGRLREVNIVIYKNKIPPIEMKKIVQSVLSSNYCE